MEDTLKKIQTNYQHKISSATSLKKLDEIFLELFGKNGEITLLPKKFSTLEKTTLTKIGPLFNQLKTMLEKAIEQKRMAIREESYQKLADEGFDINAKTQVKKRQGRLHPVTQFEQEIIKLFSQLGFEQFDVPEIDTDYNNFEVLNIPANHPARDLWDTMYIDHPASEIDPGKLLLRTHTSNAQVRIMKENNLPIRMMILGRCFRYENVDARHEHTFEQFEIVYIDKGVSMTNLQYLSEKLLQDIFGKDIKVRLRPKYYPFVEPGVGVDALCMFCKGQGCNICGNVGWLEVAGAGMIHPTVLKNGGIDPNQYSGIAWGFGTFRMAMLKYNIPDIRVFNSGDLSL